MGTMSELKIAEKYYLKQRNNADVATVEISKPYANRGSSTLYRLYIEIIFKTYINETKLINKPQ
jgi:hypothetical protein